MRLFNESEAFKNNDISDLRMYTCTFQDAHILEVKVYLCYFPLVNIPNLTGIDMLISFFNTFLSAIFSHSVIAPNFPFFNVRI